jgi:PAS domain S-box-containing protein
MRMPQQVRTTEPGATPESLGAEHVLDLVGAAERVAAAAEQVYTVARVASAVVRIATVVAREVELERMLPAVLDEAAAALGAGYAHVFLLDEAQGTLRLLAQRQSPEDLATRLRELPLDAPLLAARCARTARIHVLEDAARAEPGLELTRELCHLCGCPSAFSAPLLSSGRLVGVLTCGLTEVHHFGDDELAGIRSIAEVVGVGLANALAREAERRMREQVVRDMAERQRVERELRVRLRQQEAVASLGQLALGAADAQALMARAVALAARALTVEHALVIERDAASGAPVVRAAEGLDPALMARLLAEAWHESPPGHALAVGEPVIVEDLRTHPRFRDSALVREHGLASGACVPVAAREGLPAVLAVLARRARAFTPDDVHFLQAVANVLALAAERRHSDEALAAERAWLETVIDRSPVAMFLLEGPGGERLRANCAAAELCGTPLRPDGGPGQCLPVSFHTDGTPVAYDELPEVRALRGEVVTGQELVVRRRDGREVPVLMSASPIRDGAGRVAGAIAVADEITVLKEMERARKEWMSIIAHDLRQPITVISGYAGMLLKLLGGEEGPAATAAQHILASTRLVARMTADLLDVSRIETRHLDLKRQPTDVTALVRAATERAGETLQGRPLRLTLPERLPLLDVDPGRLEQVLGNLLSNAVKYGDPGTPIDVTVEQVAREVRVSVTNVGPGIPAEEQPFVFDRFRRAHTAKTERVTGLGRGLYIAKGLVEAHGGRIWAESVPYGTTTFCFTLPLP